MAKPKKEKTEKDPLQTLKKTLKSIKEDPKLSDKQKEGKVQGTVASYLKKLKKEEDKLKVIRTLDKDELNKFIGKPFKTFYLINEKYNENIEPSYFWALGFMRDDRKVPAVEKIIDTYSAAEGSAFAKSMGQSLGALQDRVTATMKSIGQLVKELFQLVREIRVLKEKLDLYHSGEKGDDAAEISLKGQYIDLVEGGAQSPSSVYGLASKVGFTLLPDLFFRTHIFDETKVDKIVGAMKFNEKVKEVLKRKLRAYAGWRNTTKNTLEHREKFTIKYLRSHYNAILMNLQWLKPYLKQVQRLQQMPGAAAKPDILTAIEQAYVEIEIFGKFNAVKPSNFIPVVDVYFTFRTNPEMMYDQQMQYRKPVHTGRIDMKVMSRVMTEDQVLAYKVLKEEEDFELLSSISKSIEESLAALGKDLQTYLKEAKEEFPEDVVVEKEAEKLKRPPVFEPFLNVFRGFKEIGQSLFGGIKLPGGKAKGEISGWQQSKDFEAAKKKATQEAFLVYWVYKKSHRMITW